MADLATFGGKHSEAHGINDSGQVVGWAEGPDNTYRHAFLWQNGVMVDLNDLPLANGGSTGWEFHDATAINSQGQIVAYGSQDGQGRALLLTPAPGLPAFVLVGVAPIVGGIVRRLRRR
jgi:probable HAF family extracellular repeat protein